MSLYNFLQTYLSFPYRRIKISKNIPLPDRMSQRAIGP
jgi:hypothetical protein